MRNMTKDVYIDGCIVIATPNFKYFGREALGGIPEGALVIKPNKEINGLPCLWVDDDNPVSSFPVYHGTQGFSALGFSAYYLNGDYKDAYAYYKEKIAEIELFAGEIKQLNINAQEYLYKLLYLNVVTILDAFLCQTLVAGIMSSEESFIHFYDVKWKKNKCNNSTGKYQSMDIFDKGKEEKKIILTLLKKSFASIEVIKDYFNIIYGIEMAFNPEIKEIILMRHRIVHRNARKPQGDYYSFTKEILEEEIKIVNDFVDNILEKVAKTI